MPDAVTNTPRSSGEETVWLSIVMPAYNAAATIGRAIESVLVQTHGLFELVAVTKALESRSHAGSALAGLRGMML
jgi:Glycosyl transferase family 2